MYIEVKGKIYTFYDHAAKRMKERRIAFEWIEDALRDPDDEIELTPGRQADDKVRSYALERRKLTDAMYRVPTIRFNCVTPKSVKQGAEYTYRCRSGCKSNCDHLFYR